MRDPRDTWRYTEDDKQAMVRLYQEGASLNALGQRYGCKPQNVRHILLRRGVEMRPRGATQKVDLAEAAEMLAAGESQQKMADRFGVSQATIGRLLRQVGLLEAVHLRGAQHGSWKGGRVKVNGYVYVLAQDEIAASMSNSQGYTAEHRLVVAQSIGRPLEPRETVHHINGDRTDNRLENLQLRQNLHGAGSCWRCAECGSTNVVAAPLDMED